MKSEHGSSIVEFLIAAPILLLFGLGALQAGLLLKTRLAVRYSVQEAAREAAYHHAQPDAAQLGLARGLNVQLYGANSLAQVSSNLIQSRADVALGMAQGWIQLKQISPTENSFRDWAVQGIDDQGNPIDGLLEIPNDNLHYYMQVRDPVSGVKAMRGQEKIGNDSEQTLLDANTLKLQLAYGAPLNVPLVGPMIAWTMRIVEGCNASSSKYLGLISLGAPTARVQPRNWVCSYLSPGSGQTPRLPIVAQATTLMQSAARRSDAWTQSRSQGVSVASSLGVGATNALVSLPSAISLNPGGANVGLPIDQRPVGYTHIGGTQTRVGQEPGLCPNG
jgi:TadE-like protein